MTKTFKQFSEEAGVKTEAQLVVPDWITKTCKTIWKNLKLPGEAVFSGQRVQLKPDGSIGEFLATPWVTGTLVPNERDYQVIYTIKLYVAFADTPAQFMTRDYSWVFDYQKGKLIKEPKFYNFFR